MPNAAPRPWRMFLPLAIVLLITLLWTIYWFIASSNAQERFTAQRAQLAEQGLSLSCTHEEWGGYPFHLEFSCRSPIFRYHDHAELRASDLLLVALAYAPWQVAALMDGPSTLTAEGLAPTAINHERALAAVTFDGLWQPSFSAEVPKVSVDGAGRADKLMLFTRPSSSSGTEIAVQASQVTYTADGRPPLSVDSGSLKGTLLPDERFQLDTFELKQGQLRYWGSGMLALDGEHRISGQVDTETNDMQALLSVVGPQSGLSDDKLANLRAVLALLGTGAKVPILAKNGVLYVGPFQVSELKPLY